MPEPRDSRYEWHEIRVMSGEVIWSKRCLHVDVVSVESGGETVAHLCLVCDQQLPEEWEA